MDNARKRQIHNEKYSRYTSLISWAPIRYQTRSEEGMDGKGKRATGCLIPTENLLIPVANYINHFQEYYAITGYSAWKTGVTYTWT